MTEITRSKKKYVPGMYAVKKSNPSEVVGRYLWELEQKRNKIKKRQIRQEMPPTVCFSRKIGVGALEVADILASNIGYHVVDREIIEHIAQKTKIREKTIEVFDEVYPGKMDEFRSFLVGEKSFTSNNFARNLFSVAMSVAFLGPTIFVGRGTHLILPRNRVLEVRLISSRKHRVTRLATILNITEKEADRQINKVDKEQRDFFKKVFGEEDASPYEFDLIINFDYLINPQCAAEIVKTAFSKKFGSKVTVKASDLRH